MTIKNFIKALNGKEVEGEIIQTFIYSLITSAVVLTIFYFLSLKNIKDFFPKYSLYLFLLALSFAIIIPILKQVRAYKQFACMPGMMIGMTTGMIAGFLPGFYIASTNGMFIGSMVGMSIGIIFGIWDGKSCGIMGIMEGIMAGFMGGLMGAMTAFMLLNDHLKATAIIVFIICSVIATGLMYMIYNETRESKRELKENQIITIITTVILVAITTWIMVFGPRSFLFS